jgi:hypothetical protein
LRIVTAWVPKERSAVPWGKMRPTVPLSVPVVGGSARAVERPEVFLTETTAS